MADSDKKWDIRTLIAQFRKSDHWAVSLARDLLWIVTVVGGVALALFLICGTWPAVVTIESQSMAPHMNVGDVIIYKPNGLTSVHPIIHRAIQYVDNQPVSEIKGMQLLNNYTPPHEGYITWGDNNPRPDQGLNYPGIGVIEPVKDEWIVGKALFSIPLVGYLPLHIIEVTVVVVGIMVLYELYQRSRENKKKPQSKKKRKRQ
jgi:signal peptidase